MTERLYPGWSLQPAVVLAVSARSGNSTVALFLGWWTPDPGGIEMDESHHTSDTDRRQFLKLAAASLAALSLSSTLLPGRGAAEAQEVDPKDPMAASLGYQCEGAKAPGHVEGQFCKGCQLYSGAADAKSGPCTLFQGKLVCSEGWCKSWVKRA